jgi:hypothetical protein
LKIIYNKLKAKYHESNLDRFYQLGVNKSSRKMFSAVQTSSLDLTMLDPKDHSDIKFKEGK